jgi:hypothetical protein
VAAGACAVADDVAAVAAGLDACGAIAGEAVWLAEGDAAMNATLSAATIFKSLTRIVRDSFHTVTPLYQIGWKPHLSWLGRMAG